MNWLLSELAKWRRSKNKPYEHVDVEMSELRNAIGLKWFLGPGDEQLSPEELGGIIDDCLVECISDLLLLIKQGGAGIKEFELTMSLVEEGTSEDQDLRAYAVKLLVDSEFEGLKPASETYIEMAKRHTLNGEKLLASEEMEEACQFASALLDRVNKEHWAGYDWNLRDYTQFRADIWRRERDINELRLLTLQSQWNAAAWDTLKLICADTAKEGMEEIVRLPLGLLRWYLGSQYGHPRRPDVAPAPRSRRRTHGLMLRDNEIRHAVYLLDQVDVSKTVAHSAVAQAIVINPPKTAAHSAVAQAIVINPPKTAAHSAKAKPTVLDEGTVRNICDKPDSTLEEMRLDGERRTQPPN